MASWRLRRLYHVEASYYAFRLKDTADSRKDLKLNDTERMGYVAYLSDKTPDMFGRQEGRLERSFYRALHELQRIRKEREANLASVLQPTPSVTSKEVNVEPPHNPSVSPEAEPPAMPADQHPTSKIQHPSVPPTADMQ